MAFLPCRSRAGALVDLVGSVLLLSFLSACASRPLPPISTPGIPPTQRAYRINGHTYYPLPSAEGFVEDGLASWYGGKFHGRDTANGESYDMHAMTAAHRILPMETLVRVSNLDNGRETVVRINDRGPFVKQRVIDLSHAAALGLGIVGPGTARVRVEALGEATTVGGRLRLSAPSDLTKGQFYVQIGAFEDPANAHRLRRKLTSRFGDVAISRHLDAGRTFYRVQVFAAEDYREALRIEEYFEHSGFPEAFVVAR